MNIKYTLLISLLGLASLQVYGRSNKNLALSDFEYWETDNSSSVMTDSIAPDHTDMRNLNSVEISKEMIPGWNVGNSLEAIGGETAWSNPKISQRLIDSVKAAGFKSVRIPVAWSNFIDTSTFKINEALLNRVEEVVNYVLKDSMYAIINEHWDGGWMQPTYAKQEYVNNRLAIMWKQIAVHFRDYGDHLIFAGSNEVHVENNYNTPTKEYYTVQNSFNQTFVNIVRSTGGRNYYRYLAVQGFNTNIDHTVNYFTIPADAPALTEKRLLIEVHYYDPYNFTINSNSTITQWGKNATNPKKTETWANESYADNQFNKMKTKFIDKGYGVILGEYGVIARLNLGDVLNAEFEGYRKYYLNYITGSIVRHGLIPFLWDNGGTGNFGLGVFDRTSGSQAYPDIIKTIINAADSNKITTSVKEKTLKSKGFSLMQNYPNPFNPITVISYQVPFPGHVKIKIYDTLGKEITTLVNEEKQPGFYQVVFNGSNLPSGVYMYKLEAGDFTATKKLMLLK